MKTIIQKHYPPNISQEPLNSIFPFHHFKHNLNISKQIHHKNHSEDATQQTNIQKDLQQATQTVTSRRCLWKGMNFWCKLSNGKLGKARLIENCDRQHPSTTSFNTTNFTETVFNEQLVILPKIQRVFKTVMLQQVGKLIMLLYVLMSKL